ncbi:MAG: hypothetical protein M3P44_10510 [Actinomycetota bacterium]|nr:hypothetical protein [Actinomycetota bacterium]
MRRLTLLVSAVVLVDTMFYAAITPLLPKLSDEFSLGKDAAGILAGAYAAGAAAYGLTAVAAARWRRVRPLPFTP